MADLVIRGMALPKMICGEPGYVDVRIFADGNVIMVKAAPPYYEKFEAIQLPDGHGRLGDLDALDKFLHERETEADAKELYFDKAWYRTFRQILRLMQTIVPAEGGTDNG